MNTAELEEWAQSIIAAVPPEELSGLIREYRRIARDMGLAKEDRSTARKRARILADKVYKNP